MDCHVLGSQVMENLYLAGNSYPFLQDFTSPDLGNKGKEPWIFLPKAKYIEYKNSFATPEPKR